MRILVYGSINIDLNFSLDHIVKPGETISSTGLRKSAGGKGANQAASLSKALGEKNKVVLAAKTGDDANWIVEKLASFGVDTSLVSLSDKGSGQAIIQIDKNGENSIVLYGGGNQDIREDEIERVFSLFSSSDWLVINAEINNLDLIFKKAVEKGMKVVVNPSPLTDEILALPLDEAYLLIFNEIEGSALCSSEEKDPQKILNALEEKYKDVRLVLTLGEKGSYYRYKGEEYHNDIFPVKAIDTVGAGDTFLGYFVASLILGYSAKESLRRASFASALSVQKKGAMDSVPTKEEFDKLYK